MLRPVAARALLAGFVSVLFSVGCGSATGGGCGGLRPLPADSAGKLAPQPYGVPVDQLIEGGIQARITKPGFNKILSIVPNLVKTALGTGGVCLPEGNALGTKFCNAACDGANGPHGCPLNLYLDAKDRPAPHDHEDAGGSKDKIAISVNESSATAPPTVTIDAFFDVYIPVHTDGPCGFRLFTNHTVDDNADAQHVTAQIVLNTDPKTGEIDRKNLLGPITVGTFQVKTASDPGDPWYCGLATDIINAAIDILNVFGFVKDLIVKALTPILTDALTKLLPDPLGLTGVLNASSLLGSFSPPADANLELFVVPGGYFQTHNGGLNVGVMTGVNSDRDEQTRTPGLTSEPSLCVPARPTPALGQAPWNLPINQAQNRKDFALNPANEFSGTPTDPTDANGNVQDVAIGLSRTFLSLLGYHLYNSGTLCLHIGGGAISQLNAGTLGVVIQSLSNVLDEKKAPLDLVLRPQTPVAFALGAGTMDDPLIHVGLTDARLDFYAWVEQRFVRLLTVALDLKLGLNLTTTTTSDGKPAIQPTLVGIDAKNITARVSNTDLLHEAPDDLAKAFPDLIGIAAGALTGAIPPIALPSVAGFSLDGIQIQRAQTSMDDFIAIYSNIKVGTPAPLIDWSDLEHPHVVGAVRTAARVDAMHVPPAAELQALYAPRPGVTGSRPTVTLALDAEARDGRPIEWAWRLDGQMWHPWGQDANPTIADPRLLLQGHHRIEVRSRVVDHWETEDLQPVALDVLIDSVAPELHPARDAGNPQLIRFGGFDIVTPEAQLVYAWNGADGKRTAWTANDSMSVGDALALTDGGARPLTLYAKDEAGNIGQVAADPRTLGFHGRSTAPAGKGCGCAVGGAPDDGAARGGLVALALMALVWLRRRTRALLPLALIAALSLVVAGCGCDSKNQCRVDDDCAKMMCPAHQVPTCMGHACGCTLDLDIGDIGRFSSMALIGNNAYVSAYNNSWGDLMIGHVSPPGVVGNWDFVDGVPSQPPDLPNSHVRSGVEDKGDDVGRYTSIAVSSTNQPIVAYYDGTHGALKFASFGAVRWHTHIVDGATTNNPLMGGDDIGRWTSLTVSRDGKPGIAYSAWVEKGAMSGMPESQLRWAQAKVTDPQSASDWDIVTLDSRLQSSDGSPPSGDMAVGPDLAVALDMTGVAPPTGPYEFLPEGIALMAAAARKPDGSPAIAYYDRTRGNLRYVEWIPSMSAWSQPAILDGEDAKGNDTGDVGLYNSLTFDSDGGGHISYENATHDSLLYFNLTTKLSEVVDDGYHANDEQTQDGIDSPVYHLVGDSSSIQAQGGRVIVAYQDSTVVELRLAIRGTDGKWTKQYVAGHAQPFKGAYGFYATLRATGSGQAMVSSYAINQQPQNPSFFVEVFGIDFNLIP
jgi:MYXO-CTERM domain-containing protein